MPKLLELQAKLAQVESKLGSMDVPSDLLDKIDMMQKAIDSLQSQLSSVRLPACMCVHINLFIYSLFLYVLSMKFPLMCICTQISHWLENV